MIFDTNSDFFRILRFCIITIGIGVIIMLLLIPEAFAYTGPLDDEFFTINNQTTSPFNITISGNGSTDVTFKLDYFYNHNISNYDIPGSYLFVSIESNKKLSINRKYNFGSNCSSSCFSNDDYLQLTNDENGYSYVYYFNIVKWARTVGTQIDQFSVADVFTFHNLESGTATVYIYGSYANTTNEIPNLIQNVETKQQIIIGNESIETTLNQNTQEIINQLTDDCYNLLNPANYFLGYFENTGSTINSATSRNTIYYINVEKNTQYNISLENYKNVQQIRIGFTTESPVVGSTVYNVYGSTTTKEWVINSGNYNYMVIRLQGLPGITILPNNFYSDVDRLIVVKGNEKLNYCAFGSSINKIDETNDKLDDVNNSINDLNDNIIDDSIDNPNSDFNDMEDMIAHNGVITNLISLPITLYTSILNGLNQSCSEYNFGQLFGSDLKFQCINLGSLLGNTIWGVIDVLFSGFTIYAIAKKMIKVFNNFSGLNEGDVIDD